MTDEIAVKDEWYVKAQKHWESLISSSVYIQNREWVEGIVLGMYNSFSSVPSMSEVLSEITNWNYEHAELAMKIEVDCNPEMTCFREMKKVNLKQYQSYFSELINDIVLKIDVQEIYEIVSDILKEKRHEVQIFDFDDPLEIETDDGAVFANDAQNKIFRFPKCEIEQMAEDYHIDSVSVSIKDFMKSPKLIMLKEGVI